MACCAGRGRHLENVRDTSLLSPRQRLFWARGILLCVLLVWGGAEGALQAAEAATPAPGLLLAVAGELGLLLGATWASPWVRRHLEAAMAAGLLLVAAHLAVGLAVDGFHVVRTGLHSAGLLAVTGLIPVLFPTRRSLLGFATGIVALSAGVAAVHGAGAPLAWGHFALTAAAAAVMLVVQATHRHVLGRLAASETRYALAAAGTQDGLWDWDLVEGRLGLSARWSALVGVAPGSGTGDPARWLDRVLPADRARLLAAIDDHVAGRTPIFECEHRIVCGDGQTRWFLARGQAARRADGRALRLAGWLTDVQARPGASAEEERLALMGAAARVGGVGFAGVGRDGGLRWASPFLTELLAEWDDGEGAPGAKGWRALWRAAGLDAAQTGDQDGVFVRVADLETPAGERRVFELRAAGGGQRAGWLPGRVVAVRDVTGPVQADEELRTLTEDHRRARDAALAASRAKSTFLANVSHELRTPLNAIIGYAELLAEDAEAEHDALRGQDLGRIRQAGLQLLGLIDGILDLSKVEAGRMDLVNAPIDLHALVDGVVAAVQPVCDRHGDLLVVDLPEARVPLHHDATRLRQILLNLLSNAAKFTRDGTITLSVDLLAGGERVAFAVADTGPGLSAEDLVRVFEEFYQGDAATPAHGGTGLGLAISRRLAERMGGSLTARSVIGRGAVFTLELPRLMGAAASDFPVVAAAGSAPAEDPLDGPTLGLRFEAPPVEAVAAGAAGDTLERSPPPRGPDGHPPDPRSPASGPEQEGPAG